MNLLPVLELSQNIAVTQKCALNNRHGVAGAVLKQHRNKLIKLLMIFLQNL